MEGRIDRELALSALSEQYSNMENQWEYKKLNDLIDKICYVSNKEEKIEFLTDLFLTEFHYIVRFNLLGHFIKTDKERAKEVFKFAMRRNHKNITSFMNYILVKKTTSELEPMIDLLDDPLLKLYALNKSSLGYHFFYDFKRKRIGSRNNESFIDIRSKRKLKTYKTIRIYANEDLLEQPIEHYRLCQDRKAHFHYEKDPEKKKAFLVLLEKEFERDTRVFCIKQKLVESLVNTFINHLKVKEKIVWNLIHTQTTYYYLLLEINELDLYLKYRLDNLLITAN